MNDSLKETFNSVINDNRQTFVRLAMYEEQEKARHQWIRQLKKNNRRKKHMRRNMK